MLALATPGGIEHLFAEQAAYISAVGGVPDPETMDEIGKRHGAVTLGPPSRAQHAPAQE